MLDRLNTSLTLLGACTCTDFFLCAKFFAHVVSLSTSKVSPGFANTDKLKMNDSSHNYEESDEYLEDASDVDEREFVESGSEDDGEARRQFTYRERSQLKRIRNSVTGEGLKEKRMKISYNHHPQQVQLKPTKQIKKWDSRETSSLIELIEQRPCLWNVNDRTYHSRVERERALNEIGDQIGVSAAECKSKFAILRGQLGREMAKVAKTRSGQATNDLYKPSWIFWDQLQFLRPVLQPGKSKDNFALPNESSSQGTEDAVAEKESTFKSTPQSRKKKKGIIEKKQEMLETCINVLKEQPREDGKSRYYSPGFQAQLLRRGP